MRRIAFSTLALALVGCGNQAALPVRDTDLQDKLRNPLYAEYYFDDLTEQMVTLALREDPVLDRPGVRETVDRTRTRSLQRAALAVEAQEDGRRGSFLSDREAVRGEALLLDDALYFGPTFDTAPGPSLQVYLTTVVDPRDGEFPDGTAVKIGPLKDNYGAQTLAVPAQPEAGSGAVPLRTVVIWDDELKILYGFAQLMRVASAE